MAAKMYKVVSGQAKSDAASSALVGTETITASVGAGEIAIIIDNGVGQLNRNIVTATIDRLRDFMMEENK